MHFNSIPARERDHNSRDSFDDSMIVRGHMDAEESLGADDGVAFVGASLCSTVA